MVSCGWMDGWTGGCLESQNTTKNKKKNFDGNQKKLTDGSDVMMTLNKDVCKLPI